MTSSARDALMNAIRSPGGEPRNMPPLAVVNRVITHADLTLAALVEEHGLDEVLRMLGGGHFKRFIPTYPHSRMTLVEGWRFHATTEGDSDD